MATTVHTAWETRATLRPAVVALAGGTGSAYLVRLRGSSFVGYNVSCGRGSDAVLAISPLALSAMESDARRADPLARGGEQPHGTISETAGKARAELSGSGGDGERGRASDVYSGSGAAEALSDDRVRSGRRTADSQNSGDGGGQAASPPRRAEMADLGPREASRSRAVHGAGETADAAVTCVALPLRPVLSAASLTLSLAVYGHEGQAVLREGEVERAQLYGAHVVVGALIGERGAGGTG